LGSYYESNSGSDNSSDSDSELDFDDDDFISEEISDGYGGEISIGFLATPQKPKIEIKEFVSQENYLNELRFKKLNKILKFRGISGVYNKYLSQRVKYENFPHYYIDVAQLLRFYGFSQESQRVLSNLAELELENAQLLRILGNGPPKFLFIG
jgi:hypothetical protein